MRIGPKIGSIAGGVLFILILSGYASSLCVGDLIAINKTALKTVKTLRELENLLGRVADLESTVRGYILSGDKSYDETTQLKEIDDSLDTLEDLTKDEPSRSRYIAELVPLVQEKVNFCKQQTLLMRAKGPEAATALFKTERGRMLMEDIRHKVSDRVTVEE